MDDFMNFLREVLMPESQGPNDQKHVILPDQHNTVTDYKPGQFGLWDLWHYTSTAITFLVNTIWAYFSTMFAVLTGGAYHKFGLAPYIAIVGNVYLVPYLIPGMGSLIEVINSPFVILGAPEEYLYLFPLLSLVYWIAFLGYNAWAANWTKKPGPPGPFAVETENRVVNDATSILEQLGIKNEQ